MTQSPFTNVDIYAQIAEEAFTNMNKRLNDIRQPKANGDGLILKRDPNQQSFKSALIYITFSAFWLEARLHQLIVSHCGRSRAKQIDRRSYEEKLGALGIYDTDINSWLKKFRILRREICHEKCFCDQRNIFAAQDAAIDVRQMMRRIQERLSQVECPTQK